MTSELEGNGIGNGQPITFTYVKQPDGGLVTTITYPPIPTEAGWRPVTQDTYDALGRLVQRLDRPTATETITERRVYAANSDIVSQTVEDTTLSAPATTPCRFVLGFRALHDLVPTQVGRCLDNEQHVANGDGVQHTTTGLLVWRAADNWTAFTDGDHTWVNGPTGVQERLNTQRFVWGANPAGLPTVH